MKARKVSEFVFAELASTVSRGEETLKKIFLKNRAMVSS